MSQNSESSPIASGLKGLKLNQEIILFAIILIAVAVFGIATPDYLSPENLLNIGQQTSVIATVAYAMTAVIICKGIDISVGSVMAASGILAALIMQSTGIPGWLGIILVIAIGAGFGLLNGTLISVIGISPFVTTLAIYAFARGVALSFSGSQSIAVDSSLYLWFGHTDIAGIPVSLLIAVSLAVLWMFLLNRTIFGRWVYATGGNTEAAHASLIPVRVTCTLIYVFAGASAGIGALLTTGRVGSAQPLAGVGLEFSAITAAIIGGARLAGGQGSILGTALGALLLGVVNTGLSFLQVSQQVNYFVTGGFVLVAVLLSQRNLLHKMNFKALFSPKSVSLSAAENTTRAAHCLELKGISKIFPGVKALSNVSLRLHRGEVVALMGENGAGKSTLVKVLSGIYHPEEGGIWLDDTEVKLTSPAESRRAGISIIHQHFSLIPELTVAENLALAQTKLPGYFGIALNRKEMRQHATALINELQLDVDPDAKVAELTIGQCQMVEVAKAMMADAWLIVMDEPTSALTNPERDQLYLLIERLLKRNCCVLYISHKMQEIYTLASRAVVLRDGQKVGEAPLPETSESELINMMVGRDIGNVFPWRETVPGETLLEVQDLSAGGLLQNININVRRGELVALTGLMGSGRTELMRCIAGLGHFNQGSISLDTQKITSGHARRASQLGVAYVPEDRHKEGFIGTMSLKDNISLRWILHNSVIGILHRPTIAKLAQRIIAQLGVRPSNPENLVASLSGGNQQKIVIGKWLATNPRLLLLDEPTNGVDVGAKFEIHNLIAELKQQGMGILMVSSELPEALGVADRIIVLSRGRIAGELPRGATEEQVMSLAFKYV
ncbi:ATP-binding cassette domain-containing protein [[Enterobacter] lignolyticus]|uniref:ABC transporter permease n=1 Tax=[Enterobacter] lignolyticus TaxID=1334193 RepID=A0A806X804_9ENTR|nr:ATP-binding cassette domain-containing protein [[Enterobacter] lignolyticus]ALR78048.1 ABC transporter permease [[Enterobacter] lignolyticus]